jgi:hypothetical protein
MKERSRPTAGSARRNQSRHDERGKARKKEEANHQQARRGGQPNAAGVTQGQNAEQGNTLNPDHSRPIGKPSH